MCDYCVMHCRCSGLAEGGMPPPLVEPLSKNPLHFCRDDWHMGWQTQVSPILQTTVKMQRQSVFGLVHMCAELHEQLPADRLAQLNPVYNQTNTAYCQHEQVEAKALSPLHHLLLRDILSSRYVVACIVCSRPINANIACCICMQV